MTSTLGECLDYPPLGSVSSGTMRPEDLIPAFLAVLDSYRPREARKFRWMYRRLLNALDRGYYYVNGHAVDLDASYGQYYIPDEMQTDAGYLLESLFDALDEISPPYASFGAHEGDGADYGYWLHWEGLAEDLDMGPVFYGRLSESYDSEEEILLSEDLSIYEFVFIGDVNSGTGTLYRVETRERIWSV